MQKREHLVLCGGVTGRHGAGPTINLSLHGERPNVHLKITDISKRLLTNIPGALVDLLEIVSYIYAADSAIPHLCSGQRNPARWPGGRTNGLALATNTSLCNPGPNA